MYDKAYLFLISRKALFLAIMLFAWFTISGTAPATKCNAAPGRTIDCPPGWKACCDDCIRNTQMCIC